MVRPLRVDLAHRWGGGAAPGPVRPAGSAPASHRRPCRPGGSVGRVGPWGGWCPAAMVRICHLPRPAEAGRGDVPGHAGAQGPRPRRAYPGALPLCPSAPVCAPKAPGITVPTPFDGGGSPCTDRRWPAGYSWRSVRRPGSYCLLRLRSRIADQRSTAGGEALMGFGMAAMAVPAAVLTPPRWVWLVYALVFGAAALRALRPAGARAHHLHHLAGHTRDGLYGRGDGRGPGGMHGMHTAGGTPLVTGRAAGLLRGICAVDGCAAAAGAARGPGPRASVTGTAAGATGRSWRWPAGSRWASPCWRCCSLSERLLRSTRVEPASCPRRPRWPVVRSAYRRKGPCRVSHDGRGRYPCAMYPS